MNRRRALEKRREEEVRQYKQYMSKKKIEK